MIGAGLLTAAAVVSAVIGGDDSDREIPRTRLLGGPVVAQLADASGPQLLRYAIVIRLSQDIAKFPGSYDVPGTSDSDDEYFGRAATNIGERRGEFDNGFSRLGDASLPWNSPHCFVATVARHYRDGRYRQAAIPGGIGRLKVGDPVNVTVRFGSPPADPSVKRKYNVQHVARAEPPVTKRVTLLRSSYLLRSPTVDRALQRIGCFSAVRQEGAVRRAYCARSIAAEGRNKCYVFSGVPRRTSG